MLRFLIHAFIVLTILALATVFFVGHLVYGMPVAGLLAAAVGGGVSVLLTQALDRTGRR